jgi:hypothetical protein
MAMMGLKFFSSGCWRSSVCTIYCKALPVNADHGRAAAVRYQ